MGININIIMSSSIKNRREAGLTPTPKDREVNKDDDYSILQEEELDFKSLNESQKHVLQNLMCLNDEEQIAEFEENVRFTTILMDNVLKAPQEFGCESFLEKFWESSIVQAVMIAPIDLFSDSVKPYVMHLQRIAIGGTPLMAQSLGSLFDQVFKNILSSVVGAIEASKIKYEELKPFLKNIFDKIFEKICHGKDLLLSFVNFVKESVISLIENILNLKTYTAVMACSTLTLISLLKALIALFVVYILYSLFSVSLSLLYNSLIVFFKVPYDTINYIRIEKKMIAQDASLIGLCLLVIVGVFKIVTRTSLRTISEHARSMTNILQGCTMLSGALIAIVTILPIAIRSCLLEKVAPDFIKDIHHCETWIRKTTALVKVRAVPQVLTSKLYFDMVNQALKEGQDMIMQDKVGPSSRSIVNSLMNSLLPIVCIVNSRLQGSSTRQYPYVVHLVGPPGVGKSMIKKKLAVDVFDVFDQDIYERCLTPYWDSFSENHKVVLIDEFGEVQDEGELGKEFLSIVSTSEYKPPMASIDNPIIGVKGTRFMATGIILSGNSAYPNLKGANNRAVWRRRSSVVEVSIHPQYQKFFIDNKIDLGKLSEEERRSFAWLKFRYQIVNPDSAKASSYIDNQFYTYEQFQERERKEYLKFVEISNSMSQVTTGEEVETPEEIINKTILAQMDGSIDELVAQGDDFPLLDLKHKIKLNDQNARFKHKHICRMCKKVFMHRHRLREVAADHMLCVFCRGVGDWSSGVDDIEVFDTPVAHAVKIVEPETLYDKNKKVLQRAGVYVKETIGTTSEKMMSLYDQYCSSKFGSIILTGAVIGTLTGLAALMFSQGYKEDDVMAQGGSEASLVGSSGRLRKQVGRRRFQAQNVDSFSKSFVTVSIEDGLPINAIVVKDNWVLCPGHYFSRNDIINKQIFKIYLRVNKMRVFSMDLNKKDITHFENSDLCLFRFIPEQPGFQKFRDITNRIASYESMQDVTLFESTLQVPGQPIQYVYANYVGNKSYMQDETLINNEYSLLYKCSNQVGHCGGLLVCSVGSMCGQIIGMHVAGDCDSNGVGVSTIINRDMIDEVVNDSSYIQRNELIAQGVEDTIMDIQNLPNTRKVNLVPFDQRVFISQESKIQPSLLQDSIEFEPRKVKPLLSEKDPRANGDPVLNMLKHTLDVNQFEVEQSLVNEVQKEMYEFYAKNLKWPIENRRLTIEEAVGGIPGKLKKLKLTSSAGWPLVKEFPKNNGKKPYISVSTEGKVWIAPFIRERVAQTLDKMEKGQQLDHRWLGYLKDELMKPRKVAEGRTRIIYCGDLISLIAFRMLFGSLLCALNNSYNSTPLSIGLNQYSYDFQKFKNYLDKVKPVGYFAGDYKDFDKRVNRQVLKSNYMILMALAKIGRKDLTTNIISTFIEHEMNSPLQIKQFLVWTRANHMSGCTFTTAINCLNNEAYFRIVFKMMYPKLKFEEHVGLKVLGDDNIVSVSKHIPLFRPLRFSQLVEQLGQVYTSDDKERELTNNLVSFDEISFLGAYPRKLKEGYVGALKKSSIEECILWTRDKNMSLIQICTGAMEAASLWDKQYYTTFCDSVIQACTRLCISIEHPGPYEVVQKEVSLRTVESGLDFETRFVAQMNNERVEGLETSFEQLTSFDQQNLDVLATSGDIQTDTNVLNRSIAVDGNNYKIGVESFMFRTDVEWDVGATKGTRLLQSNIPNQILTLGTQNNLQNLAFQFFVFFRGKCQIKIQMNGNKMQQGLLLVGYEPLPHVGEQFGFSLQAASAFPYKIMSANEGNSIVLDIDFRFFRNSLNTNAGIALDNEYARFFMDVLSPLQNPDSEPVTISIFTRFPQAKLAIPKPLPQTMDKLKLEKQVFKRNVQIQSRNRDFGRRIFNLKINKDKVIFKAQGASQSTINKTENHYEVTNSVVGGMPSQVTNHTKSKAAPTTSTSATLPLPMDAPGLFSSSIPQQPLFSGLSRSNGVKVATSLQLNPVALRRRHEHTFGTSVDETNIEWISNKEMYMGSFQWSRGQLPGHKSKGLDLALPLFNDDSRNYIGPYSAPSDTPVNLAISDLFYFWRADFKFKFVAAKTMFHSGRLIAKMGYGAPSSLDNSEEATGYYSKVLDFTADHTIAELYIPYVAQTDYLSTIRGPSQVNPIQDSSLGFLSIFVLNQLRAPTNVVDNIEINIFVSLHNVKYAVPRPFGFVSHKFAGGIDVPLKLTASSLVAQSDDKTVPELTVAENDLQVDVEKEKLTEVINVDQNIPCKLDQSSIFEYTPATLMEFFRRSREITNHVAQIYIESANTRYNSMLSFSNAPYLNMPLIALWKGWQGSLHYRLLIKTQDFWKNQPLILFVPEFVSDQGDGRTNVTRGLVAPNDNDQIGVETEQGNSVTVTDGLGNKHHLPAVEIAYTTGTTYIDFMIPFQQQYVFRETTEAAGTIYIFLTVDPIPADPELQSVQMFQSFGDDFSLGVFAPYVQFEHLPPEFHLGTATAPQTVSDGSILGLEYQGVSFS